MKKIQLYLLLGIVIFATGCPSGPSKDLDNADGFAKRVNAFLVEKQTAYYQYEELNPLRAKRIRDEVIDRALTAIDSNYNDYITTLQTRRSTTDFVADLVDLGAGAATGIVRGERAKGILGIALTAFRGGRKSAEINFYREQTTPILISKMDHNRAEVERTILLRRDKEVKDYSLSSALRDIVAYYNAGTLVRAFTELAKDTAAEAQQSEKKVLELKGIPTDVVNISQEFIKSSLTFGDHRRNLAAALTGSDETQKKNAKENLRLIYLDIAQSTNFKAILDAVKTEKPELKAIMEKLEGAEAGSKSVDGMDTLRVLSEVFRRIDPQKQPELATEFTEFFNARLKK